MKLNLTFIIISTLLFGCSGKSVFKETRFLMDTIVEIKVVSEDQAKAKKSISFAFDRIRQIEKVVNKFDVQSELSRLNAASKNNKIKLSKDLFYCIKSALKFSNISDGAFDITVEPLMQLWKDAEEKQMLPSDIESKEAISKVGFSNLKLNEENQDITFLNTDIKIDLGGIAKGYVVDEAIKVLKNQGIEQALVNIGGNIYCLGNSSRQRPWNLGLQHPLIKDKLLGKIKLKDKGISTSGNYERFFSIKDRRISHIINPKTSLPIESDILSVTVVTEDALAADALSTAVFVLGREEGIELINKLKSTEGIIITSRQDKQDFNIWVSEGLKDKIELTEARYNRIW